MKSTQPPEDQAAFQLPKALSGADFKLCLAEFQKTSRKYQWLWWILRRRAKMRGGFPWRVYSMLRLFVSSKRPYFIGVTSDGTRFLGDAREVYDAHLMVFPESGSGLTQFLKSRAIASAGDFVDVGANCGLVAASVAKVLDSGRVIAFEPVPLTARRAAATFALNDLHNVVLFQCAIGDGCGVISLWLANGLCAFASAHKPQAGSRRVEVPCFSLDVLFREGILTHTGLIKIDVEGHEQNVLLGSINLLRRDRPEVIYEFNPGAAAGLWSQEDIIKILDSVAIYNCFTLQEDGSLAPLSAVPPSEYIDVYCCPRAPEGAPA